MDFIERPMPDLAALFHEDTPGMTMLFSVLEGRSPGEILVDDPVSPTKCVVRNALRLTFPSRDVDQTFFDEALGRLRESAGIALVVHPDREAPWTAPPPDLEIERIEFSAFDEANGGFREILARSISDDVGVHEIDRSTFDRCLWHDMLIAFCGTPEVFFQHGFGFSLIVGSDVVAESYAPLLAKGAMEIGVITAEEHRGKGFATLAAAHTVRRCFELGRSVVWSCETDNPASAAIARKLGFRGEMTYPVYVYRSIKA